DPDLIGRKWPDRYVNAVTETLTHPYLMYESAAGEESAAGLMYGDGQDGGIVVESLLHSVTVMYVDIYVGHATELTPKPTDADRTVVEGAEASRPFEVGVVQATGDVHGDLAPPIDHSLRRIYGSAGIEQRGLVHSGEGRIITT